MLMDLIKSRHSIRKYTDEQIRKEELEIMRQMQAADRKV